MRCSDLFVDELVGDTIFVKVKNIDASIKRAFNGNRYRLYE